MKELFSHWDEVRPHLSPPHRVLWFFDFDGTLAPLVRHPSQTLVRPGLRRRLRDLAKRHPGRVGILSGRPVKQVRRLIALPGLIYGGTHGYEIQGPGFRWRRSVSARARRNMKGFLKEVQKGIVGIPGLWIENKEWTFCVHYRQTRVSVQARVRAFLKSVCNQARALGFKAEEGIKVVEVYSDARWDKGQAMRWLLQRVRVKRIFYVGDDTTDEAVFRVLGGSGIGVRIGRTGFSRAAYYLKRQSESAKLLKRILTL